MSVGLYGIITSLIPYNILSYFWSLLTPGQQWLEIGHFITSVAATAAILWFLEEVSTSIDTKIATMKKDLDQKDERISQLEIMVLKKEEEE